MASWFFIHYRKSVTSNTFQFRDDSKFAINKTFCGHKLHWFKKIKSDLLLSNAEWNYNREQEKSKYLDNTSVLPTSIFIFDKFVDGAQPEVAGEIAGRRHILRTLGTVAVHVIMFCIEIYYHVFWCIIILKQYAIDIITSSLLTLWNCFMSLIRFSFKSIVFTSCSIPARSLEHTGRTWKSL